MSSVGVPKKVGRRSRVKEPGAHLDQKPDSNSRSGSRTRVKGAVIFALTTIIPCLVLLYILRISVGSKEEVNPAWMSCVALLALGIALLGGKLLKEAWTKLVQAVKTLDDLQEGEPPLKKRVRGISIDDEIDRIPHVVNHLANIAKRQQNELEDYKERVQTLSSKVQEADRELQDVSREDPVTGLYNRRYFKDRLEQEVARTKRYGRDLALAIIEVDSFQNYTDTNAQQDRNKALSTVGMIIGETIRRTDLAFRYSDDQFAIILPETTAESARHALERIRAAVDKRRFKREAGQYGSLDVRIGVSMLGNDRMRPDQFVSAAHRALFRAKSAGRNGVVAISED